MESQTRWVTQTVYTKHMQRRSGWASVNKVRENTAVFTAERRYTGSNINVASRRVNTELIITPGRPASMHLRSSADARHERSDTAVSQDAEGSWLWVRGDITWKLYMNPVIRRQTCPCAVPQGLSDMETSSRLKQNRRVNRGRRNFWGWLVAQHSVVPFSTWLREVKLPHFEVNPVRRAPFEESLKTEWSSPTAPRHLFSFTTFNLSHFFFFFFCCSSRRA